MPRPSKHISSDTLGGRIRAAREDLHLSLKQVASGHYSTSLISQIERNRVDPSHDSLIFLANRLKLPLQDLEVLAQQHRQSEIEANHCKSSEDLRIEALQLFNNKEIQKALDLLESIHLSQVPILLRWRLTALRGHCYFEQREFLKAQNDFIYAVNEQPKSESVFADQRHEIMLLHLHLADTYRELDRENALEEYQTTLQMMNHETPFGYVAEAHWGMSLIAFKQAYKMIKGPNGSEKCRELKLRTALEHGENARFLYRSIDATTRVATITCHLAQIEKELGNLESARRYLHEIIDMWLPILEMPETTDPNERPAQLEKIAAVSAATCTLAGMALEEEKYEEALKYISWALQAGEKSYLMRYADAHTMHGRIWEAIDLYNPEAEKAFREATKVLAGTKRIGARISAHIRLGRHLLKKNQHNEGHKELDIARYLSDLVASDASYCL